MNISDFDGARFWPAVRQFVIDAGVEPISLGEPQDEVWRKIRLAADAVGKPLSLGLTGAGLLTGLAEIVGGGVVPPIPDFDPSKVTSASLLRAWDFSASTPTAAAYGTSTPITLISGGTAPTISLNEVKSRSVAIFAGAAKGWTFAPVTMGTNFDMFAGAGDLAPTASGSSKALLGKDVNNAAHWRWYRTSSESGYTVRLSGVTYTIAAGYGIPQGFHVHHLQKRGANLTAYCDGKLVGTAVATDIPSIWDSVGWNQAGAFFNGGMGEIHMFDGEMSAPDIAANTAYLMSRWRSDIHVDFLNGVDTNSGWNFARAVKTFGLINTLKLRNGETALVHMDRVHNGDGIALVQGNVVTTEKRVTIKAALGTGTSFPRIEAVQTIAGPWTLVSGTVYKAAAPATVATGDGSLIGVVRITDGSSVYRLWTSDSTACEWGIGNWAKGQWFHTAGELYINIGKDPSGVLVEFSNNSAVVTGATSAAIAIPVDGVDVLDIDVGPHPGDGVSLSGSTSTYGGSQLGAEIIVNTTDPANNPVARKLLTGCPTVQWVARDAINIGGGSSDLALAHQIQNCNAIEPGLRFGITTSFGDLLTGHGSAFKAKRFRGHWATKGGIANLSATKFEGEDVKIYGSFRSVFIIDQPSNNGLLTLKGCEIERAYNAGQDDAILLQSSIRAPFTVTLENNTFIGAGATRGTVLAYQGDVVTNTTGSSFTGFNAFH